MSYKLVINALSAKHGGSVSYMTGLLPELRKLIAADELMCVWKPAEGGEWPPGFEYRSQSALTGVLEPGRWGNMLGRLAFDQVQLPAMIRREGTRNLFSSANFGSLSSPCRQVLLVRNSLYFDRTYLARSRRGLAGCATLHLERQLVLQSMRASDVILFPSAAMRDMVADWLGRSSSKWRVAHYGIRHDLFGKDDADRASRLGDPGLDAGICRVLHTGYYADQKNLGTLLKANEILGQGYGQAYCVFTTAWFRALENPAYPGMYPALEEDRMLFRKQEQVGRAVAIAPVPYLDMPGLYRGADIFVFPSYTESFGHPLVEAMASGVPVVAADQPTNREICGDAALYFETFNPESCADAIRRFAGDSGLRHEFSERGRVRSKKFQWQHHARILVDALA